MTDTIISTKLRILTPDDGMALTDGTTYTTGTVYLAHSADASRWREIPESEIPPPEERPQPPPLTKTYNRYKVVTALKAEGVWRDVRAAMLAQDEDALDMLYTAEDISEDEPLLLAMIAMLKAVPYNWTDEQVAAVLAQAEIGGAA